MIEISVGVLRMSDKVLITKRRPADRFGGFWEFPGGKIEPKETPQECLVRELKEELGIDVKIEKPLMVVEHATSEHPLRLHSFWCRLVGGELKALEVAGFQWVACSQLRQFAFPPASQPIVERLQNEF